MGMRECELNVEGKGEAACPHRARVVWEGWVRREGVYGSNQEEHGLGRKMGYQSSSSSKKDQATLLN